MSARKYLSVSDYSKGNSGVDSIVQIVRVYSTKISFEYVRIKYFDAAISKKVVVYREATE